MQSAVMTAVARVVFDLILGPLVALAIMPWLWQLLMDVWHNRPGPPQDDAALVVGALIGVLLLVWRKPNMLLITYLHETAHALMCVLLFVRVGSLQATDGQGGEVRHQRVDPVRTMLILIAPYILPLLAGPLLGLRYLCEPGILRTLLSGLCALALVLHLGGLAINIRFNTIGRGADLQRVGHLLAFVLIAAALLLLACACVVVFCSPYPPAWWMALFHR